MSTALNLGTAGSYTWYLDYDIAQSVVANQSTITYTLRIHKNAGTGAFWGTPARDFRVTIDGTNDVEGFSSIDFTGVTNIDFTSGSKVITHNADGTHSPVSVGAGVTGSYVSSSFPVPTSFSGKTISLPTIPRAATSVTRTSGTETGSPTVLALSPLVDSFYYVLKYKSPATGTWTLIGSSSGIVGTSWPYSTTIGHGEIPDAGSGTIQFQITTLDSSGGTQIGSPVEVGFVYTVPASVVPVAGAPTWAEGATTTGLSTLTNSGAVFAQGWSKLKPTFSSTPGTGASVVSAVATVNGVSGNTVSGTAFAGVVSTQGSACTYDVAVTDSRGRVDHDTGTVSPAVHRWATPTVNAGTAIVTPTALTQTIALSGLSATTTSFYLSSAQRNVIETRTGYRDLTTAGAWVYGSWTAQTLSSSDSTDNAYAPGSPLTVVTGLDPTHEYEVVLQVRDIFGKNAVDYSTGDPFVESSLLIPAQEVLVAFDGNTRVGFGKIPTQGTVDVAGDLYADGVISDAVMTQAGNSVIDTGDAATTSASGIVELATDAETIAGTDPARATTPAGVKAARDAALASYYLLRQTVYFTSSGTFSKASYPWLKAMRVRVIGGGAAGGYGGTTQRAFGGGGAGACAEKFITDIAGLSSSVAVTIGAGGVGAASAGTDGSASSFGALAVAGGGIATTNPWVAGGPGGTATAGDLLLAGGDGGGGSAGGTGAAGMGGASIFGGGGAGGYQSGSANQQGEDGRAYGSGGGGCYRYTTGSSSKGGSGAPGIVVLELFG